MQEAAGKVENRLMLRLAKHFYHVRGLGVLLLTMAITDNKTKTWFVLAFWIVVSCYASKDEVTSSTCVLQLPRWLLCARTVDLEREQLLMPLSQC